MSSLLPIRSDPAPNSQDPRVVDLEGEDAERVFSALSSSTAREIVAALHEEPRTQSDVAEALDTSVQNVRYHVEKLEDAGLVEVVDTWYSSRGNEMDVYAPADGALIVSGDEDEASRLRRALSRLVGGVAVVGMASLLLQAVFDRIRPTPETTAAPAAGGGGGGGDEAGGAGVDADAGAGGDGGDGISYESGADGANGRAAEGVNGTAGDARTATEAADAPTGTAAPTETVEAAPTVTRTETPVATRSATRTATDGATATPTADPTATATATSAANATAAPANTPTPVDPAATTAVDAGAGAGAGAASGLPPGLLFFLGGVSVLVAATALWYLAGE